jgi:hypothetical protein
MGSIQEFIRERKADRLGNFARNLKYKGKFAEAARVYEQQAAIAIQDNELIYSSDCEDAFEMWMKAGDVRNALEQARNALHGYTVRDWLKGENAYIDRLLKMVNDLYRTDHADEADLFLSDINKYLGSIGEDPVTVTVIGKQHRFPDLCPHCGGAITYHGNLEETECPFCQGVVHAL